MNYNSILGHIKGLIEIHNRGKFHQYSIFGAAENWIFGCFWVVLQGLLLQMKSVLYKIFTSDAVQGNSSHILRFFTKSLKFLKIQPKTWFSGSFLEAFRLHSLTPFELRPNVYAKSKVSWKCTIVISFIVIAFVVGKLKNLKCFRGNVASRKWPIVERFWALTPPNMVRYFWNLHHS